MTDRPRGEAVPCPECDETAFAIIPEGSRVVEDEDDADGKTWVNCRSCGGRFLVYFRFDR